MTTFHLILLIAALIFGVIATWISGPGFTWQRAISAAFTCFIASLLVAR